MRNTSITRLLPEHLMRVRDSMCLLIVLHLFSLPLAAQNRLVSGKITAAEDKSPVPGVNVLVKGTSTGTISDIDGKYTIQVPDENATLVFSFIGLQTKELNVGNQSVIDVSMESNIAELSEVVVTAFGLEREKKALGYTVQEISGEQLAEARQANVANSLSGKVAGVQVISNAGPGSGSSITIRGQSSISGNNHTLWIELAQFMFPPPERRMWATKWKKRFVAAPAAA